MKTENLKKFYVQLNNPTNGHTDLFIVYASNDEKALSKARTQLYKYQHPSICDYDNGNDTYWKEYYYDKYKNFEVSHIISIENNSSLSEKDDIIDTNTQDTNIQQTQQRESDMAFFTVNWNNYTKQLALLAAPEIWSNETYPNNGILANYMINTYKKLQSERNIIFSSDYALFNTGLFTKYYEPIYAYQSEQNISFLTGYELSSMGIEERPERANYFTQPELLLFDWHYPIDVQYKHILEDSDNRKRLPQFVQDSDIADNILTGTIDKSIKMVMANYKLAIPQYFGEKIQLLLPLYFTNTGKADLALVLTKINNYYQGHTCITLDMAYNNARLIAKPENNWLSSN